MRLKNYKIVCIILSIIVSLSGIFLEDVEADNTFAWSPNEITNSYIQSASATIEDAQVCTTETLGVRSNSRTQQLTGRYTSQKGEFKRSHNFLCPNIFLLQEGRFFSGSEITQIRSGCFSELVINYIHKSDGKKESKRNP